MNKYQTEEHVIIKTLSKRLYDAYPEEIIPMSDCSKPVYRLKFSDYTKIIKMSSDVKDDELNYEVKMINILEGKNLPVPVIEYQDLSLKEFKRLIMIMQDSGESFRNRIMGAADEAEKKIGLYNLGRSLALLQNGFSETEIKENKDLIPVLNNDEYQEKDLPSFLSNRDIRYLIKEKVINEESAKKIFKVTTMLEPAQKLTFAHGDYHLGQVVSRNGNMTVVDWEDACFQDYRWDLCISWMENLVWVGEELNEKFLDGYKEHINFFVRWDDSHLIYFKIMSLFNIIVELKEYNFNELCDRAAGLLRELLEM